MSFLLKGGRQMALFSYEGRFSQLSYIWPYKIILWRPEKLYPLRSHIHSFPPTKNSLKTFHLRPFVFHQSHPSPGIAQDGTFSTQVNELSKEVEKGSPEHFKIISDLLHCSMEEVEEFSKKHKFLKSVNLDIIQEKIQLVLSYGFTYSFIHQNLRFLKNVSAVELERRLKLLEEHSLLDFEYVGFKLNCPLKLFLLAFEKSFRNKQALEGCANQLEYIQHRLQCSEDEAKRLLSMSIFAKGFSSYKLKQVIDFFLLEAEVSPKFVIQNAKLLAFSLERLRYRLQVMEIAGVTHTYDRKQLWYCSSKEFNEIISKILEERGS